VAVADATAADAQRIAREEREWAERNPPQSDPDPGVLTLWNFPVGKADLAPEHVKAIEDFVRDALIQESRERPQSDWVVLGRASVTGKEQSNQSLAQRRADNVAAVLRGLGLQKVRVPPAAGSSDPDPEGTDPQALARNRRVTVLRVLQSYPVVEKPPEQSKPPPRPQEHAADTRVKINLELPVLRAPKVNIAPYLVGELRVFLKGTETDPVAAGVITSGHPPNLTGEFSTFLAEHVIGPRLGVSGGEGKEPPTINIAIAAEEWFRTPKVTYQHGPYFISFNFNAVNAKLLPVVPYGGADVYLEFGGSIHFEIGPSDSALGTYPSTSDPGPNVSGTIGEFVPVKSEAALVIAATITDAGKHASQLAQDDIKNMVLSLARRDGAASRVAWEVLGEVEGRMEWERTRYEWDKRVGPEAKAAWIDGSNQVEGFLIDLEKGKKGAREERKTKWKGKYTAGGQTFDFVREGAFQDLRGYDQDQGDLLKQIEGL
jgi:outer membrane protein OmpA-like peptidoglycan-associated protein